MCTNGCQTFKSNKIGQESWLEWDLKVEKVACQLNAQRLGQFPCVLVPEVSAWNKITAHYMVGCNRSMNPLQTEVNLKEILPLALWATQLHIKFRWKPINSTW